MMQHNLTEIIWRESSLGPAAQSYSNGDKRFDFTLLFEQSTFAIAPSAVLLLACPLRFVQLLRKRRKVVRTYRTFMKTAAYVVLGSLQLTLLGQWAFMYNSFSAQRVSLAASILGSLDALVLATLSYMEHNRSVRPSTIISAYLILSIMFDAVQCRTLWLLGTPHSLAAVFSAMLASKIVVFVLETHEKSSILLDSWKSLGKESTSGLVSKSIFWWLNSLMMRGFSASLSLVSLDDMDKNLRSKNALQRISNEWNHRRGTGKHALFKSVICATRGALIKPVFARLCLIGFKFAQPFLIQRMINYVTDYEEGTPKTVGYALIGATGLIYLGSALSTGFYEHKLNRHLSITRAALSSLILDQTLHIDGFASTGSATLTLVNSDVSEISGAFSNFHEIWANTVEVCVAIYLLQRQVDLGAIGPSVIVILCTLLMGRLSKFMGPAVKAWNDAIQKRVSTTSSILGSIKETKMLGMIPSWKTAISSLRVQELQKSKKFRTLITYMNILANTPAKISPVVTFGIAILPSSHGVDGRLSTATAFTAISIMSLIHAPLAGLLFAVPMFTSSLGSFERIGGFLEEAHQNKIRQAATHTSVVASRETYNADELELSDMSEPAIRTEDVIIAKGASFRIEKDQNAILEGIDIQIPPRSLTVVAGKVGSGKTILLRGLLGELHTTGYLQPSTTGAAYCAQTAWLINSTVRKNILGQSTYESKWYDVVVCACALDRDFLQFPNGDSSLVGSKGLSLSGGQKQRVTLARAIYSREPVMVIDDVLSGLDWATQSHVWSQVFGPTGLLRRLGTTVILGTHSLTLLSETDRVVLLGDDGRIKISGTLSQLKASSHINSILLRNDNQDKQAVQPGEEAEAKDSGRQAEAVADKNEMADLLQQDGEASLYAYYFKSIGWRYTIAMLAIACISTFTTAFIDVWMRFWTEANADAPVNTGYYFGIYSMLSIIGLLFIGLDTWFMFVQVIPKSANYLHGVLLDSVMSAPLSFFSSTDNGDLINRFSKDMTLVDRELPQAVFITLSDFLSTIARSVLVLLGASYFGAIVPAALVFIYGLQKFYLRTSRQLRFLSLQTSAPLYSHILDTVDGLVTIRAFGWQSATREHALELLDNSLKPQYLLTCIQRWLTFVLDMFVAVMAVLLVTFGVLVPRATSPGAMALALTSLLSLSQDLASLIMSWTSLETSLGAMSRLRTFEDVTPREMKPSHSDELPARWPSSGSLQIDGVKASYSTDAQVAPALNGITLSIESGEKVAICGRTGSGKSSLILTLFRLLDLDEGTITIDGLNVSEIAHDALRARIISVPQEATLFPGTLRDNLYLYAKASHLSPPGDEALKSALRQVELWESITLRGNLDTDVEDLAFSQGQKQLVCLARAVLCKQSSAILVLDEAMSAVDEHTEEIMVKVIDQEFAQHTVISVVHRLNTVLKNDKIVMMERGEVTEVGHPDALLALKNGKFRSLWDGR